MQDARQLSLIRGRLREAKEFVAVFCTLDEKEQKDLPDDHHTYYAFLREIVIPKSMARISQLERILEGFESTKDKHSKEAKLAELHLAYSQSDHMFKKARDSLDTQGDPP